MLKPNWKNEFWSGISESAKESILSVYEGKTLQEVADNLGVTRERVRQLVSVAVRKLRKKSIIIAETLFEKNDPVTADDIKSFIQNKNIANACIYVLTKKSEYKYIDFTDSFYKTLRDDWYSAMSGIAREIVGESTNYIDNLEIIEDALQKTNLSCFDFTDFHQFLIANGYHAYGDYITLGKGTYANVCYDAIAKFFPNGIKLDSDENNSDIITLRQIIKKNYGNMLLPEANRALTARISTLLILCDRGKYQVPERIECSAKVLEDIMEYINNSPDDSLYYSEIFSAFQGRLLMETNIDNYNYLHGIIKYYYPNDFQYDRDTIIKIGRQKQPLEDKLEALILSGSQPVSRATILENIQNADTGMIAGAMQRNKNIIQWAYNQFNHMDNIVCTESDILVLKNILTDLTHENRGYCNERKFFIVVQEHYPEFLAKNNMEESLNLFYVACNILTPDFRFSRPHIVSPDFPLNELTNETISDYFIGESDTWTYTQLLDLSKACHWANSMLSLIVTRMEKNYIRITVDEYIKKTLFKLTGGDIEQISNTIKNNLNSYGYVAFFAAFTVNTYPAIEYSWNEFLLHSVITEYLPQYRIIEPQIKDRRYKRGIIVVSDNPCNTYEELVISVLESNGLKTIQKNKLEIFLCTHGLLLTGNIPIELNDGNRLVLKDNYYTYYNT